MAQEVNYLLGILPFTKLRQPIVASQLRKANSKLDGKRSDDIIQANLTKLSECQDH